MTAATTLVPQLKEIHASPETTRFKSFIAGKRGFFFRKRVFDVVVSLLFIVFILSWVFPVVALLILLDTGGPVLFLQRRVGRAGRTFTCFKFRTMQYGADGRPRISPLGNFLRRSNIDEFPQFLNVLIGNMSMVGPRPHMHADCQRFSCLVPRYKLRNFVKPGITGLAQINGCHGPAIGEESIMRRYEWDRAYIMNACLWLDIRIIRQTAVQSFVNLFRSGKPQLISPFPRNIS
ncbi:MAG TPA: sugar transferase [Chitinophagaceae bacterium]|nr:sugar transferase [Chitinophagaceae bacterium]